MYFCLLFIYCDVGSNSPVVCLQLAQREQIFFYWVIMYRMVHVVNRPSVYMQCTPHWVCYQCVHYHVSLITECYWFIQSPFNVIIIQNVLCICYHVLLGHSYLTNKLYQTNPFFCPEIIHVLFVRFVWNEVLVCWNGRSACMCERKKCLYVWMEEVLACVNGRSACMCEEVLVCVKKCLYVWMEEVLVCVKKCLYVWRSACMCEWKKCLYVWMDEVLVCVKKCLYVWREEVLVCVNGRSACLCEEVLVCVKGRSACMCEEVLACVKGRSACMCEEVLACVKGRIACMCEEVLVCVKGRSACMCEEVLVCVNGRIAKSECAERWL